MKGKQIDLFNEKLCISDLNIIIDSINKPNKKQNKINNQINMISNLISQLYTFK